MTALLNNPAFWGICTAIGMAFAGYIKARTAEVESKAASAGVAANAKRMDAQSAAPTQVVTLPAAAGGAVAAVPLRAKAYNQLTDVLPDGALDPQRTTSCGEESTSMTIEACGGPAISAGQLRVLLGGIGRPGWTNGADLVYLLSLFNIPSHTRDADPETSWIEWQHSFGAGYLVIARGYWVTQGMPHWILIRETTASEIVYNDPWGGVVRRMDKATAQKLYLGDYVHVDQAVAAAAPAPPNG